MKKIVLITGASSGIGKQTAIVFAEKGYNLVLVARRLENLKKIKANLIDKYDIFIELISLDLSKNNSAEKLMKNLDELKINSDILINNAGFGIKGDFVESDNEKVEQMMILNMITLTKLTKFIATKMIENGKGHIINIASTAAFQPVPKLAVYSATKSFVLNFSEAIEHELRDKNIKVSVICPGATQSEFAEVAGFDDGSFDSNLPTSRDLAEYIYNEMLKGSNTSIHGLKNKLLVFSGRFSPRKMIVNIAGKMIK